MGTQNHEIWRFYTPNIWKVLGSHGNLWWLQSLDPQLDSMAICLNLQPHEANINSKPSNPPVSSTTLGFHKSAMLQHLNKTQTLKKNAKKKRLSSKPPWIPQVVSCLSSVKKLVGDFNPLEIIYPNNDENK